MRGGKREIPLSRGSENACFMCAYFLHLVEDNYLSSDLFRRVMVVGQDG